MSERERFERTMKGAGYGWSEPMRYADHETYRQSPWQAMWEAWQAALAPRAAPAAEEAPADPVAAVCDLLAALDSASGYPPFINAVAARVLRATAAERDEARELLTMRLEDMNKDGKTILDFYAVWLRQARDRANAAEARAEAAERERDELREWKVGDDRRDAQFARLRACVKAADAMRELWVGPAEHWDEPTRGAFVAYDAARREVGDE